MNCTATSTSAITPSKKVCAASSAYQIPHYTCALNIRRPMQACLHTTKCTISTVSLGKVSLRACSSAFEPSVQAYPKVQIRSSTLAVKLCCRSVALSTLAVKLCCCSVALSMLAVKLCCCSVASSMLAVKLCCRSIASSMLAVKLCCCSAATSTLRCDYCRSFDPFEWVEADTLAVFSFAPVDGPS